jgi:hypothetical protein
MRVCGRCSGDPCERRDSVIHHALFAACCSQRDLAAHGRSWADETQPRRERRRVAQGRFVNAVKLVFARCRGSRIGPGRDAPKTVGHVCNCSVHPQLSTTTDVFGSDDLTDPLLLSISDRKYTLSFTPPIAAVASSARTAQRGLCLRDANCPLVPSAPRRQRHRLRLL